LSYFNWISKCNEFWADFGVYIIKLHFNGYSCNKELSLEFNCSIARATVILVNNNTIVALFVPLHKNTEKKTQVLRSQGIRRNEHLWHGNFNFVHK
jgi:hypothetical protein